MNDKSISQGFIKYAIMSVLSVWLIACTPQDEIIAIDVPKVAMIDEVVSIKLGVEPSGFDVWLYVDDKPTPRQLKNQVTAINASELGAGQHKLTFRFVYQDESYSSVRYLTINQPAIEPVEPEPTEPVTEEPTQEPVTEEPTDQPDEPIDEATESETSEVTETDSESDNTSDNINDETNNPTSDHASDSQFSYAYEVINRYPHSQTAYTQGLEFYKGDLYETTGLYGHSSLRKLETTTGKVLQAEYISRRYFGEGVTFFNDMIYWLTWREHTAFRYDVNFNQIDRFYYQDSRQGWGLTNDGQKLIKSDGTERLWFLDAQGNETGFITVKTAEGVPVDNLNELEYFDGYVFANIYLTDNIAVIDINTGEVKDMIDMRALRQEVALTQSLLDDEVLNGIAYNPDTKTVFVTGKHWNTLFELKLTKTKQE